MSRLLIRWNTYALPRRQSSAKPATTLTKDQFNLVKTHTDLEKIFCLHVEKISLIPLHLRKWTSRKSDLKKKNILPQEFFEFLKFRGFLEVLSGLICEHMPGNQSWLRKPYDFLFGCVLHNKSIPISVRKNTKTCYYSTRNANCVSWLRGEFQKSLNKNNYTYIYYTAFAALRHQAGSSEDDSSIVPLTLRICFYEPETYG